MVSAQHLWWLLVIDGLVSTHGFLTIPPRIILHNVPKSRIGTIVRRRRRTSRLDRVATIHSSLTRKRKESKLLDTSNPNDFVKQVHVMGRVLDPDACLELHHLAQEHSDRSGDGSSVFSWDPCSSENKDMDNDDILLTPLEQALKRILQELYFGTEHMATKTIDDNNDHKKWVVEYWSREEYMNMDTHSDIDERLLMDEGIIECPHYGHVLYLQVDPSIRGPTCVFSQLGGWHTSDNDDAPMTTTTALVTVPAVEGRLLQFPGSAMHAVPKPATLWFHTEPEQDVMLNYCEEDLEETEDNDEDEFMERSVILFNVWLEQGPRGVTEDFSKGGLPDGIELLEEDDDSAKKDNMNDHTSSDSAKEQRILQWEGDYGVDCCDLWCQPRNEWTEMTLAALENSDNQVHNQQVVVPLMGNKSRRLNPHKHVTLWAPLTLQKALQDPYQAHIFLLGQNDKSDAKECESSS